MEQSMNLGKDIVAHIWFGSKISISYIVDHINTSVG